MVHKVYGRHASFKLNTVFYLICFFEPRLFSCGICLPPSCGLFLLTFISRCLDTFDSGLNIHILYFYMVTNFLNSQAVVVPIWCVLTAFDNSKRLTYVTSFYRSIKVNQSAGCQYCSRLRRKIGRFMLPCLYALPLTTLWKSYLFVADDIKFFNPHNVHREGILLCVISAFPRCSFDSMSFC